MRVERIQDDVTAFTVMELREIAPVGIGDHGSISPRERTAHQFLNGRALPRTGGPDHLEMLGLVLAGHRTARPVDPRLRIAGRLPPIGDALIDHGASSKRGSFGIPASHPLTAGIAGNR